MGIFFTNAINLKRESYFLWLSFFIETQLWLNYFLKLIFLIYLAIIRLYLSAIQKNKRSFLYWKLQDIIYRVLGFINHKAFEAIVWLFRIFFCYTDLFRNTKSWIIKLNAFRNRRFWRPVSFKTYRYYIVKCRVCTDVFKIKFSVSVLLVSLYL